MQMCAKIFTVSASFFILGSLAAGGPAGKASTASVKKPVFKCSTSFSVTEELPINATAFASPGYKNQVVNYALVSGPDGMSIDSSTGKLSWTPSHNQTSNPNLVHNATVKAYDAANSSAYATKNIKIKVVQVNTRPTVTCASGLNIESGDKLLLQANGSDPDIGQKLKYTLSGAPSGASINSTTGVITWQTKTSNSGAYTFKVVATDNGIPKLSGSCSVTVNVSSENHAPTLAAIADKTATVGNSLSFTASASDQDSGQTLSFSLSGAPTGASINSASGKFTWTPSTEQAAASTNYSFAVRVTDSGSPALSAERTVKVSLVDSSSTQTVSFPSKLGPLDNPLKGWIYQSPSDFGSMLFTYVSWKDLEPSDGYYDFSSLDQKLNSGANAGKHIVFRVYLDYPGVDTGVPKWLTDSGVALEPYRDDIDQKQGLTPDYNNPLLVSRLTRLIDKLGERFDSDSRIAFVQVGIMGQYGEWTTYRAGKTLRYSVATQRAILDAFKRAFPNKQLLGRQAGISYDSSSVSVGGDYNIGYHDDMFPYQTYSVMMPPLSNKGKLDAWQSQPMGGELWPYREDLMLCDAYSDLKVSSSNAYQFSSLKQPFNTGYEGTKWRVASRNGFTGQDITIVSVDSNGIATADKPIGNLNAINGSMQFIDDTGKAWSSVYDLAVDRVKAFRPSFMRLLQHLVTNTRAGTQDKLNNLSRLMGYQFRLANITLPKELKVGQDNALNLNIVNEGVAPFYYKWKVTIALMDGDIVRQKYDVPWDIRHWQPGSIAEMCSINPTVSAGTYDLAIKIEDPWYSAKKPGIEFANSLRFDSNGWTHLMQVTLK